MNFTPTSISEVVLIEPQVFGDDRGFFMETWNERAFRSRGIEARFVQDNHSTSRRWVLRGMHYQTTRPQGRLVRVTQGDVFDVAVDLRRSSRTFGRWVGERLSATNRRMLWIPPGFAHGFLTLTDRVQFLYKCTDFYDPASERCLRWDDPEVGIEWPLPPSTEPILSQKDGAGVALRDAETYG